MFIWLHNEFKLGIIDKVIICTIRKQTYNLPKGKHIN